VVRDVPSAIPRSGGITVAAISGRDGPVTGRMETGRIETGAAEREGLRAHKYSGGIGGPGWAGSGAGEDEAGPLVFSPVTRKKIGTIAGPGHIGVITSDPEKRRDRLDFPM
jgi:hypothetical protein